VGDGTGYGGSSGYIGPLGYGEYDGSPGYVGPFGIGGFNQSLGCAVQIAATEMSTANANTEPAIILLFNLAHSCPDL